VILGFDGCRFGLGLVIAGMVILTLVWVFVEWNWWKPPDWWGYVWQEIERAGRVPLRIIGAGAIAMIGGLLFLAIDGC